MLVVTVVSVGPSSSSSVSSPSEGVWPSPPSVGESGLSSGDVSSGFSSSERESPDA